MSHSRGAVVMVDLEPVRGSEQGRRRPCIIMSDLATIRASNSKPLYVIVPLTRSETLKGALAPRLLARAGGLPVDSTALVMHLRSVDPRRVTGRVGKLDTDELGSIQEGIRALFELE